MTVTRQSLHSKAMELKRFANELIRSAMSDAEVEVAWQIKLGELGHFTQEEVTAAKGEEEREAMRWWDCFVFELGRSISAQRGGQSGEFSQASSNDPIF